MHGSVQHSRDACSDCHLLIQVESACSCRVFLMSYGAGFGGTSVGQVKQLQRHLGSMRLAESQGRVNQQLNK